MKSCYRFLIISISLAMCSILIFLSACNGAVSPSPASQMPYSQAPVAQPPVSLSPANQSPANSSPTVQTSTTQIPTAQPVPEDLPTRDQIGEQYKWNLKDVYSSDAVWEQDFERVKESIPQFKNFEGKLGESSQSLLSYLRLRDEIYPILDRLDLYAACSHDQDLANATYQALYTRMLSLRAEIESATAFTRPEILAIDDQKLAEFLRQKDLALYKQYIDNITRMKPHTLSGSEENLLAMSRDILISPENIYGTLTGADFTWPSVKDEQGKEVKLSPSRYADLMQSKDRSVRQDAYKAYFTPYESYQNTLASLYDTEVKAHIFNAKARGYSSSLESYQDIDDIPVNVYTNLISSVHNNLDSLQAWAALREKVLGLDEVRPYDINVPLFPESEKTYSYEEAQVLIEAALKPLGAEYGAILDKGFRSGWVDLYATKNKRNAGYGGGVYGVHPIVFLNSGKNLYLSDVLDLAHEMGHAVHRVYENENQPYVYSADQGFKDEIASLTNELLVLNYLLQNTSGDQKLAVMENYLNLIVLNLYGATRYAEFELITHEKAESGEALTAETLSKVWSGLFQKYWGPEMKVEPETGYEWARVMHFFYYNFYSYNYSTSLSGAEIIVQKLLAGDSQALKDYLAFLAAGSSDYSIELVKRSGADLSTSAPVDALGRKMGDLVSQMETLINNK
jgi:oligoendopeptidase F